MGINISDLISQGSAHQHNGASSPLRRAKKKRAPSSGNAPIPQPSMPHSGMGINISDLIAHGSAHQHGPSSAPAPKSTPAKPKPLPKPAPAPASAPAPAPAASAPAPAPAPAPSAPPPAMHGPAAPGYPYPNKIVEEREIVVPKTDSSSEARKSKGDLVAALLFALVIVNGFSAGHFKNIIGTITGQHSDPKSTHNDFLILMGELVFVVGVSMIAQVSDGAANFTLSLTMGLWLVWGVQNGKSIANFAKKVNPNG